MHSIFRVAESENGCNDQRSSRQWMMHVAVLRGLYPFFSGVALGGLAMILHECGHLATAFFVGVRVKQVGLKWDKGLFTVRESGSAPQNLVISLAGPSVNLLLIATEPWFPIFSLANLCYALANMLPIEGSDGFRVAECWRRIREGRVAN
jgi:Zn-dependent protease